MKMPIGLLLALIGIPLAGPASAEMATIKLGDNCADDTQFHPAQRPTFSDRFDSHDWNPNQRDWYYRTIPNGKLYSTGSMLKENVTTDEEGLRIRVGYDSQGNPTGGGVISRHLFGYGYYEIEAANFNATTGFHESFWSMGVRENIYGANGDPLIQADIDSGRFPENNQLVEIDGYEFNSASDLDMGTYPQTRGAARLRHGAADSATFGLTSGFGAFHTFAYDWQPDYLKFYIDGRCTLYVDQAASHMAYAPSNFWLTAIKTSWLTVGDPAQLPGTMTIRAFNYWPSTSSGVNWIGNSDFEAHTVAIPPAAGSVPPGWIVTGTDGAAYLQNDVTHGGDFALSLSSKAAYTVSAKQTLEYIPNGLYTLSAWIQSGGTPQVSEMTVTKAMSKSSKLILKLPHSQSKWRRVALPVNVTTGEVTIAFTTRGHEGDYVRIDDVSFVKQTRPTKDLTEGIRRTAGLAPRRR